METSIVSSSPFVDSIIFNKLLVLITKFGTLASLLEIANKRSYRNKRYMRRSSSVTNIKTVAESHLSVDLDMSFASLNQTPKYKRNTGQYSTPSYSLNNKSPSVYSMDHY